MLGRSQAFTNALFPAYSMGQFSLVANIGLIFFMFFLGLELDPMLMQRQLKVAAPIAVSAIAVPIVTGILTSLWLYDVNDLPEAGKTAFVLFFGENLRIVWGPFVTLGHSTVQTWIFAGISAIPRIEKTGAPPCLLG